MPHKEGRGLLNQVISVLSEEGVNGGHSSPKFSLHRTSDTKTEDSFVNVIKECLR